MLVFRDKVISGVGSGPTCVLITVVRLSVGSVGVSVLRRYVCNQEIRRGPEGPAHSLPGGVAHRHGDLHPHSLVRPTAAAETAAGDPEAACSRGFAK